jgi:hypothetical protein
MTIPIAPITVAAIDFASPAMLGWLAAAALPWLINLWSRRRHVETPWAAVDLLMAAVRERSRRLRLRELLLLALRTAILLLIALAAAGPIWRQATNPGAAAERTHHVIVIDQSFSMATRAGESSRFERAKARARQIVEDAPAGDAFTVIAWSERADNILGRPTFEAAAALAAIDAIEPLDTVADLAAAARAVDAAITSAKKEFPGLTRTRTAYISDLGLNTWSPALQPRALPGGKSAVPTNLTIGAVNENLRENIAVTNITTEPPLPILDRPLTVAVQVKSFGREPAPNLSVELLLDDERLAQQTTSLEPGGEATVRFETRLVDAGKHIFEARLDDYVDALAVDNRRWLSTEATRGPRALCVADVATAAEDIARALNPRYREGASADAISVEVIPTAALAAAELATYDAVFLANLAELSPREQRIVARYVANGGAILIVLGDRLNPPPSKGGARGGITTPLPANQSQNAEWPFIPIQIDQPVSGDWRLDPLDYRHPVLKPFAGRTRSGLLGVRISKYFPLRIASDDHPPTVALAFNSGDPALIIGEYGLGRIAVLATDPALTTQSEPWSTLAVSPSFVPLVRELFAHLTADRRAERLNRLAGEPLTPVAQREGEAPAEPQSGARLGRSLALPTSSTNIQWRDPTGALTSAPPEARLRGIYTLKRDDDAPIAIAVNVDPAESDLTAIDPADLPPQTAVERSASAASTPSYAGAIPLQHYFLAAAVALVLIELTAAWLFGRGWA